MREIPCGPTPVSEARVLSERLRDAMDIYILSRGRAATTAKLSKSWSDKGFEPTVVVDSDDAQIEDYANSTSGRIVVNRFAGIGGARATAIVDAVEQGRKSILMSDDDIKPTHGDYRELLRITEGPKVLGIGAKVEYHDFAMKGTLERTFGAADRIENLFSDVILCPIGCAFRLFSINIDNAQKLSGGTGFDTDFSHHNEDCEFMRQGIAELKLPWLLAPQHRAASMWGRHRPGGVADSLEIYGDDPKEVGERIKHSDKVIEINNLAHSRWPKYVSPPKDGKCNFRTSWRKMMDDHIPGWKEASAAHGGEIHWSEL